MEPAQRKSESTRFFETVFSDSMEEYDLCFYLWMKDAKTGSHLSEKFTSGLEAGDRCRKMRATHEVYYTFGMRDSNKDFGSGYGGEEDVAAIPGFVLDFDVNHESKASGREYFKSMESIVEFCRELVLEPTFYVASGSGIHAYWMFDEVWRFNSEEDRLMARRMSTGWFRHIEDQAQEQFDPGLYKLQRIWRPTGTQSHKTGNVVEMISGPTWKTYDPYDHFDSFIVDLEVAKSPVRDTSEIHIGGASMTDQIKDSIVQDALFAQTWHHLRVGLKSQSEHDFAIMSYGMSHGWTEQESVDAAYMNRAIHGSNPGKLLDARYWRTSLGNLTGKFVDVEGENLSHSEYERDMFTLSQLAGVKIVKLTRRSNHETIKKSFYMAYLQDGDVLEVGSLREFRKQSTWRDLAFVQGTTPGEPLQAAVWGPLVERLLTMKELEQEGDDDRELAWALGILDHYLAQKYPYDVSGTDMSERASVIRSLTPHILGGRLLFHPSDVYSWARKEGHITGVHRSIFTARLARLGFEKNVSAQYRDGRGKMTSKNMWRIEQDELVRMQERIHDTEVKDDEGDENSDSA
jgi:hypothetical protein